MGQQVGVSAGRSNRYYEKLGLAIDAIVRCKDCQRLITQAHLREFGCCVCGNKRFAEVTTLSPEEHAQVTLMDFPYKDQFLAEFRSRG